MRIFYLYHFSALKKEKDIFRKVVIPAEAGIQISLSWSWIPVFTGMTGEMDRQRAKVLFLFQSWR
jgi:hypothetical protein